MCKWVYSLVSNKERGGLPERMFSLEEPLPTTTPRACSNHEWNMKFQKPLQWQESYQIRKGEDFLKECLA